MRKLLGEGRYRKADTAAEKARRAKYGLRDGVITFVLMLPVIAAVNSVTDPSPAVAIAAVALLSGVPLGVGLLGEIRSGRAYGREREAEESSDP